MSEDRAPYIPPFVFRAASLTTLEVEGPGCPVRMRGLRALGRAIDRSAVQLWSKPNAGTSLAERIGERVRAAGAAAFMSSSGQDDEHAESRALPPDPEQGDDFAELFASNRGDLTRLCRRMLQDSASVDDALSEIFLRAHRAWPQYDPERPFKPWLRTLAANHCIDRLRRLKTERGIFGSEVDGVHAAADEAPSALAAITLREERRDVLAALDALPDKYRLPLVLRFYRDLDYEAIAETLGVSRPQVGTLLFRAKRHLREELARRSTDGDTDRPGGARR